MQTEELIHRLSLEAKPVTPLPNAAVTVRRVWLGLCVYLIAVMGFSGFRADIAERVGSPFYLAEVGLAGFAIFACASAAVRGAYPDLAGGNFFMYSTLLRFGLCVAFAFTQFHLYLFPINSLEDHGLSCALSISLIGAAPGVALFLFLKKGAVVIPAQAGAYAIMTGLAVGCFALRLIEANNDPVHLALFHYLPTITLTVIGAYLGKKLLSW